LNFFYEISPLHHASLNGHINVIKLLLEKSPQIIQFEYQNKNTPLHMSASKGHFEVVKLLVENNANIYSQDSELFFL